MNQMPKLRAMKKALIKETMEWYEIKNDADIEKINSIYSNFEDTMLVKMEYVSGDYIDNEMVGWMEQSNDLKVLFQRLDRNPFSIELWFTNTKRMNMFFVNPQENKLSDMLYAKVCRNENSLFWTVWKDFDPYNEEHLLLNDIYCIESQGLKWRIVETQILVVCEAEAE